jgi:hypothetical protein
MLPGAITDETLKKGQVKVTVIATGFPEANMPKASLFSGLTRSAPKTEVKEEPLKKNEIPGVEPEAKDEEVDTTPSTPSTPASNLKDDDDEHENDREQDDGDFGEKPQRKHSDGKDQPTHTTITTIQEVPSDREKKEKPREQIFPSRCPENRLGIERMDQEQNRAQKRSTPATREFQADPKERRCRAHGNRQIREMEPERTEAPYQVIDLVREKRERNIELGVVVRGNKPKGLEGDFLHCRILVDEQTVIEGHEHICQKRPVQRESDQKKQKGSVPYPVRKTREHERTVAQNLPAADFSNKHIYVIIFMKCISISGNGPSCSCAMNQQP